MGNAVRCGVGQKLQLLMRKARGIVTGQASSACEEYNEMMNANAW